MKLLDSFVDNRFHHANPILLSGNGTDQHRRFAQPIQLVNLSAHRHVSDEVIVLLLAALAEVNLKVVLTRKAVVYFANFLAIAQRQTARLINNTFTTLMSLKIPPKAEPQFQNNLQNSGKSLKELSKHIPLDQNQS